jgi:cellulose synthase/poly-beta-1,6-N-acetylglucosamine synthase-like glycosyltransferase
MSQPERPGHINASILSRYSRKSERQPERFRRLSLSIVYAVVLTFNRRDLLRQCLGAITGQTVACDAVIVVDNGSCDGTAEMVRKEFGSVELCRVRNNIGAAGGFSLGIRPGSYRLLFRGLARPLNEGERGRASRHAPVGSQCGRCDARRCPGLSRPC